MSAADLVLHAEMQTVRRMASNADNPTRGEGVAWDDDDARAYLWVYGAPALVRLTDGTLAKTGETIRRAVDTHLAQEVPA